MWRILQQDVAEDYVIATGVTNTVRTFVEMAFREVGIELEFKGKGADEKAYVVSCSNPDYQIEKGQEVVAVDERYYRRPEVELLIGDPSKSMNNLNWKPKYDLAALVKDMMASDLELFRKDQYLQDGGHKTLNYYEA